MIELQSESSENAPGLLLTVEQAAARLGCGRTTMYGLIKSGAVRAVHVGSLRRIRPVDLAAYVDSLGDGDGESTTENAA